MAELATVARPYAEATFKSALEKNRLGPVAAGLAFLAVVANDEQMRSVVGNPKVSAAQKKELFAAIGGDRLDGTLTNLVAMLIDNHREVLIGSIAAGLSQDLVDRAASVTLKEGRKLVLVLREAPIGVIHLDAMAKLARAGACILPASPGFYTKPKTIEDLLTFMTVKLCRVLGIEPPDAPGYEP